MPSPINPKNFEPKKPRTTSDIIEDICTYPIFKFPSEPLHKEDKDDVGSFMGYIGDVLVSGPLAKPNEISAQSSIDKSLPNYEIFWDALEAITEGQKLSPPQQAIMGKAPALIELLAQENDETAHRRIKNMTSDTLKQYDLEKLVDVKVPIQNGGVSDYLDYKRTAHNLRQGVVPLFHELAASLNIKFDKGAEAKI